MAEIAVIVGGAERAMEDYARATAMLGGRKFITLVCNDMIAKFPHHVDHLVTLHPDKLLGWLTSRKSDNLPHCDRIWSHKQYKNITTDWVEDWGGSSGFFMIRIATEKLKCNKIILCGVPMEPAANHFVRHVRWSACEAFWRAWIKRGPELKPFVRSLSGGGTEEMFGVPTEEWLGVPDHHSGDAGGTDQPVPVAQAV